MKKQNTNDETKRFGENKRLIYAVAVTAVTVLILGGLFFRIYSNSPTQPKAAIVDQLSSSKLAEVSRHENQTFIQTAEELLYKRFSKVDYYKDNATVEQYKRLATENYKLIIWRAHSALDQISKYVAICTSQKYIPGDYGQYLSNGYLTLCNITGDPNLYLGITPKFIRELMDGRFEDTVIVFMSCNGLKQEYYATAEAFIEKGAKVLISWDGWVDASDNDKSIASLLDFLINDNNTISVAVNKILPYFHPLYGPCDLDYHPMSSEVSDYVIPDYRQNTSESSLWSAAIIILVKTRID